MPPRGGLAQSLGEATGCTQPGPPVAVRRERESQRESERESRRESISPAVTRPVLSSAEDSPSGLWRSLGKRVGCENPQGFESLILRQW